MFDVTRWWYKRGVAGFRLDAVDTLFEDPDLRDNPVLPGTNKFGDPNTERTNTTRSCPACTTCCRDLRKVADEHDAVLIGETWTKNIDELKQYYGEHNNELQMPMDFMFTRVDKLSAPEFRRQIAAADSAGGWPIWVITNHDILRSYNRYGDGAHNDDIAKLMAALYLTLRGTPIMYYGEEIGMENNDPKRREDVKDPDGQDRLAQGKRPRWRAHAHAVDPTQLTQASARMIHGYPFLIATKRTTWPPNRRIRIRCWSFIARCWP